MRPPLAAGRLRFLDPGHLTFARKRKGSDGTSPGTHRHRLRTAPMTLDPLPTYPLSVLCVHGQTDVKSDHPPRNPHLTDLGRRQGGKLGQALRAMGFSGVIYSSSYFRTMETAQAVGEVTGTPIVPTAEMREYVIRRVPT